MAESIDPAEMETEVAMIRHRCDRVADYIATKTKNEWSVAPLRYSSIASRSASVREESPEY